jgi:hypothetical protein
LRFANAAIVFIDRVSKISNRKPHHKCIVGVRGCCEES